jgi:hypothetical protein
MAGLWCGFAEVGACASSWIREAIYDMRVDITPNDGTVLFRIRLDRGETQTSFGQANRPIQLITNTFSVSHHALSDDIHPDLLALAALIIVKPWVGGRVVVSTGISRAFAETVKEHLGFEMGPVDSELSPRPQGAHIGLLFSGGMESVAVREVIPKDSPLIHLRRVRHRRVPDRAKHLRTQVNVDLAAVAAGSDDLFHVVDTDVEFMCRPYPTYPSRYALGIGAVLLADELDLGGVARGTTIHGRYFGGKLDFVPDRSNRRFWKELFWAAGLPIIQPMSGGTEVVAMQIVRDAGLFEVARSCQLGERSGPCQRCHKCFRKQLIVSSLERSPLPRWVVDNAESNDAFVAFVRGDAPYYMQHIFEYALSHIPDIEGTIFGEMAQAVGIPDVDSEWASGYYEPAFQELVEPWRDEIASRLSESVRFMSSSEREALESWSAHDGAAAAVHA